MKSSGNGAVIEPLLTLEREDLSGTLEFRARGATTSIHVRAGEIVFAEGGTLGETLGRMLVRYGRINEEHFGALVKRLTDAVVDATPAQLGDIAVQYGFLTREELDVALTQQVKEKIMGCIHRGPGDWRFIPDNPRVDEVGTYVVRTRPTLVEVASYLSERHIEQILCLEAHRFPELVAPASVVADEFELTREEAELLSSLNGTSSLHFLIPMAPSPKLAALTAALVLGGGVVLRNTPADAKAANTPPDFLTRRRAGPRADHESMPLPRIPRAGLPVLGSISDASSWATVAVARPVRDRRSSRESLEPLAPDPESRAHAAYARLLEDLEARKPVSERRRWPEPTADEERRLMAEAAFQRGCVLLRTDTAERALPGLHRALELCTDEPEYELFVKWAQMLVNDTFVDDDRRAEIEALAVLVARRDHTCALAFAVLGHCALKHGKEEASLRFFQRAALLDPKLVDPVRLDELVAATSAKRKGPLVSRPEVRSKARGGLETPLDEIVPATFPRPRSSTDETTDPEGTPPDSEPFDRHDRRTPHGGLLVAPFEPAPTAVSHDPPPAPAPRSTPSLFPASRLSSLPPPAPEPTPAVAPAPPPEPSAPSAPPPSAPGTAPMRQPLSPWRIVAAQPPESAPSPLEATRTPPPSTRMIDASVAKSERREHLVTLDDPPFGPATAQAPGKNRRRIAWAAVGLVAIGATGGVFHAMGSREPASGAEADAAPFAETTRSSAILPPAIAPSASAASVPTEAPPQTKAAASAPAPAASASTTASAADPRASTTATLRTPKGWGHRVFFDGRSLGDGGRDLTVPCGTHRVKVGSAGVERTVTLPCGGAITVE